MGERVRGEGRGERGEGDRVLNDLFGVETMTRKK